MENEMPDLLYWLRKGYKRTYSPSVSAREMENNKEIVRCFSDSIWGISREAVANIIYNSSTFLNENYHSRLDNYFFLYLLVLHQYYGLLLLAKDASELSSKPSSYMKHQEYNKLKNIRERLNFFYLKCVFTETSHISHQSELYKCMWDRLGVESMLTEIQYEVERISSLIDEVREEQKTIRNKIFIIIASIFTIVSTFEAVWSVLSMAKQSYPDLGENPLQILFFKIDPSNFTLTLAVFIISVYCIVGFSVFALTRIINTIRDKINGG
jgi:hypothetical protein